MSDASNHINRLRAHGAVCTALPQLWARRIYLFFLPPYGPELNAIEGRFRVIKHDDLPARVCTPFAALEAAVDDAYTRYELTLLTQRALGNGELDGRLKCPGREPTSG